MALELVGALEGREIRHGLEDGVLPVYRPVLADQERGDRAGQRALIGVHDVEAVASRRQCRGSSPSALGRHSLSVEDAVRADRESGDAMATQSPSFAGPVQGTSKWAPASTAFGPSSVAVAAVTSMGSRTSVTRSEFRM